VFYPPVDEMFIECTYRYDMFQLAIYTQIAWRFGKRYRKKGVGDVWQHSAECDCGNKASKIAVLQIAAEG